MATAVPRDTRAEGRVPPHDLDAEQSVLGAILQESEAITRVLDFLNPEDFYRENHAQIYRACIRLFQDGEPIDNVTVTDALDKQGVLERVGGRAGLLLLQETVPTSANVEYYGRIVKEHSYKRRLIQAGGKVAQLGYDPGVEAEDALSQAQAEVYGIAEDRIKQDFERLYDLLRPAMDRIDAQMASGKGVVGIPSGFTDLDRLTSGFKPGELVIVAGRPGIGKTSWCLNVILEIATQFKVPVAMFSLEMSKDQLVERLLCEHARIDAQRMHRGQLSDAEYDRLAQSLGPLSEAPIFIDDAPTLDELTVLLKSRQIHLREKVGMIIIDYLQLMHGRSRGDDANRVQEVSAISRALKMVARELGVPVVAISQLSRAVEQRTDKRPMLSDLRESGCLAADTPVYLPATGGYCPIKDLVGRGPFEVMALNSHTWRLESATVSNAFSTGVKPVFRLKTRLGRVVRATANHRFLTLPGWRRLDQLAIGDRVALPRVLPSLDRRTRTDAELALRAARVAAVLESPSLTALATSDVYWDAVVSIEPDGVEEVFDLTVDSLHNFVAGDVIVHNSIEQDSDQVIFLYRDDYYKDDVRPGIAEVILAKNRNGPTGKAELRFVKEQTRFYNLEARRPEPAQ
jgi:replicative DNA helicase